MSSLSPGVTVCPSTVTLQKRQSHMSINYHWVFIGQLLTNGVKLLKLLKSGGARVGLCPPQSPLNNWSARDSKYIEGSSCSSRRVLWKKENTIINKMFSRVHTHVCVLYTLIVHMEMDWECERHCCHLSNHRKARVVEQIYCSIKSIYFSPPAVGLVLKYTALLLFHIRCAF